MKELFNQLKTNVDQAELYHYESVQHEVTFQNGKLTELEGTIQSGYSLRIIKDNTLGFAYTKTLTNPALFLESALNSLKAGTRTNLYFPENKNSKKLRNYDPGIENITNNQVVDECRRIIGIFKEKLDAKIDIRILYGTEKIQIMNSQGTELTDEFSSYLVLCEVVFPNTAGGLYYLRRAKNYTPVPDRDLNDLIEMYKKGLNEIKIPNGKMKVLFLPTSLYVLLWRLQSGTAGNNIYHKKSPLVDKIGEKIFSEKLTIYDDPLNEAYPFARCFDDEGVSTNRLMIVEKGVLKNFYYDLFYADKMGVKSTGCGYKGAAWGGEFAALKPVPALEHLIIEPGEKSLKELIRLMDRGIIVAGVLGAHSGNIPNGDFSIGIEPCLYVENGEIIGRAKNTMIAGNIYNVMKNVVEVENQLHPTFMAGKAFPAILFDEIMVVSA
ncbi:MAG: TldD/PmbA family protein [candidate division WOR-3 bacterium]|nr:TldD/PmbA family protein [candidate division WOR-3 bacterium]